MHKIVDYTAFALGCVLVLAGCVSVLTGRAPSRFTYVGRPRLFGVWCVCTGVFSMAHLPALQQRVVDAGSVAVAAVPLLMFVGLVALFLSRRPGRR
ncbi:hypothetical protein ABZ614_18280 [Streptomyces sp. NPDC013178]|uniref:hypothetical protein n=1 Tax=unclassified Streptomyces TaxID=2593676 RepID=UPI0033E48A75